MALGSQAFTFTAGGIRILFMASKCDLQEAGGPYCTPISESLYFLHNRKVHLTPAFGVGMSQ